MLYRSKVRSGKRPSNRFWKLLWESGLVPEPITYTDDDRLPEFGFGITNIVARATPAVQAAKGATTTIPIVMAAVADAVGSGFVASLARPGGNVTGVTFNQPEFAGKMVELLKAAAPRIASTRGCSACSAPTWSSSRRWAKAPRSASPWPRPGPSPRPRCD